MSVGVLGCGQLGRMLALAGYPLGLDFSFLGSAPHSATAELGQFVNVNALDDLAFKKQLAGFEAVTFETENTPLALAKKIESHCPVYPSSQVLAVAQNRLKEKKLFTDLEIPTPLHVAVDDEASLLQAANTLGYPFVLKTTTMGYDGKGQMVVKTPEDLNSGAVELLKVGELIAEAFVPFARELSIIGVRNKSGDLRFYPLVENIHHEGILRYSLAPAPDVSDVQALAENYLQGILAHFNYVGVLTLELFQLPNGELLANEMAPRVHNSGHWTQNGATTSQFENHLRALMDWPLGDTKAKGHTVMVNLLGQIPPITEALQAQGHVHLYNKEAKPKRKLGHINYVFQSQAEAKSFIENHRQQADIAQENISYAQNQSR